MPGNGIFQMIQLTRLNKSQLVVNSDLIKFIESAPDTVITLVSGEKVVVLESADEVVDRIVEFRRRIYPEPRPTGEAHPQTAHACGPPAINELP